MCVNTDVLIPSTSSNLTLALNYLDQTITTLFNINKALKSELQYEMQTLHRMALKRPTGTPKVVRREHA